MFLREKVVRSRLQNPNKLKLERVGHTRSPWAQLGLLLLGEAILFFISLLICVLLFGWRSPQNVLWFALIAPLAVNVLFVLSYPLTRSSLDYPIGRWFKAVTKKEFREDIGTLLRTARKLKDEKFYEDAYRLFEKALILEPTNSSLLIEVAQFTEKHLDSQLSVKHYRQIVELGKLYIEPNILLTAQARLKALENQYGQ